LAPLILSIAAGIRAQDLSRWLGDYRAIVRCMPNTPALIGMGITGMVASSGVSEEQKKTADAILRAVGQTVWLDDEAKIDPVTAVSGSGPAYVFYFIEAMQQAPRTGSHAGAGHAAGDCHLYGRGAAGGELQRTRVAAARARHVERRHHVCGADQHGRERREGGRSSRPSRRPRSGGARWGTSWANKFGLHHLDGAADV